MKKTVVVVFAATVFLFSAALVFSAEQATFKATASKVVGGPEVTPADKKEGVVIKNGTTIREGDRILAGFRESLTLTFNDGSVAFVRPLSQIKITRSIVEKEAAKIHLTLNFGAVRATVPRKEAKTDFRISTPTVTCSVKGTEIKEVRANIDMPDAIMMGRVGVMEVKRNPAMTLGGKEGTNSNFINPINLSQNKSWVPQTQFGNTNSENSANKYSSIPLIINPFDFLTGPSRKHARHQAGWTDPPRALM